MIFGRFGNPVTILRLATLDDVRKLQGSVDKQDRQAIENDSYVVVDDHGKERLYHQAFLKADRGSVEITEALELIAAGDEVKS